MLDNFDELLIRGLYRKNMVLRKSEVEAAAEITEILIMIKVYAAQAYERLAELLAVAC